MYNSFPFLHTSLRKIIMLFSRMELYVHCFSGEVGAVEQGDGLMDKVSALQPRHRGFEPHTGHDHDSSYVTSTGWFQETDARVI